MYLRNMRIWNFRKYGGDIGEEPGLDIDFNKKFNLIIGENDSGKSTVIDAIQHTLGTLSGERNRITDLDFHVNKLGERARTMIIECRFSELSKKEAGIFLEWLTFDNEGEYELLVRLSADKIYNTLIGEQIFKTVKAGPINFQNRLGDFPQELLRTAYLKPLRDANKELRSGYQSRLAQILKSYSVFKIKDEETHELEKIVESANSELKKYFDKPIDDKTITGEITKYLTEFFSISLENNYKPKFEVTSAKLNDILKKLSLELDDQVSGLGSSNLLYIAVELLLLNDGEIIGPNLTLIEEIEAHLHPQAQLRLIKYLQSRINDNPEKYTGQFILSTHSTTLTASTSLEHITLIHDNKAYPMSRKWTSLEAGDYDFLERFLDATKTNLFFSRGVILVEGDAENLLLPAIAEVIDRPLHKYGVTIVNVGSTAFKRYSKIFSRSEEWLELEKEELKLPVSVITDVDVRPLEYYEDKELSSEYYQISNAEEIQKVTEVIDELEKEDLEEFMNQRFNKFSDFVKELKNMEVQLEDESVISEMIKKEITIEELDRKRNEKISKISEEFENTNNNLKVYIAPTWTLEYELAQSSIGAEFAQVIHNNRYKNPDTERLKKQIDNQIRLLEDDSSRMKGAYEIFKPLNDNLISKAIIAQKLAEKLIQNKVYFSSLIMNDEKIKYLVDAIYHVTEPQKEGEHYD